jgi:hypothetical protein
MLLKKASEELWRELERVLGLPPAARFLQFSLLLLLELSGGTLE